MQLDEYSSGAISRTMKDEKAKSASGDTATKTASIFLFVPTGLINPMDRNSNIYDTKIHQAKLS